MTTNRLKGSASGIFVQLVVARCHPNLALVFHPDLRGSQHMPGRMKRDIHLTNTQPHSVGQGLKSDVAQSLSQYALSRRSRKVMFMTAARMVRMRMGDQRQLHRSPGINIEPAGRTEQTFGSNTKQLRVDKVRSSG